MSEYVSNKWKEKYRCKAVYDLETGEYIRNPDGSLDTNDIYIECQGDDQIYDYDSRKSIMEAYIASKQRGRRIISEIYKSVHDDFDSFVKTKSSDVNEAESDEADEPEEQEVIDGEEENQTQSKIIDWGKLYSHINSLNNSLIYGIIELDNEIMFKFNGNKHMDTIAKFMKAKKPMASTTPFNVKFLPSHKVKLAQKKLDNERYVDYQMPTGFWDVMRSVIVPAMARKYECKIDKALEKCYQLFSKHKKTDFVKLADENNYKINHYIHSQGCWDEFIEFLQLHINS